MIFGAMVLVIAGALGYFFLISGSRAERDALVEENEVRRAEVIKAKADEANLRPFRAQAEALRKRLDLAKERLPSEREIPQVYRQVSDLATQSGLGVSLFQPKPAEDRDVLSEVPIAVTGESTYHQLGAFLERVGKMPRIVSLGDFRLVGIDRPTGTIRAEMTLATYTFRPEGAPPPPAKPGAPGGGPTPPPPPPSRRRPQPPQRLPRRRPGPERPPSAHSIRARAPCSRHWPTTPRAAATRFRPSRWRSRPRGSTSRQRSWWASCRAARARWPSSKGPTGSGIFSRPATLSAMDG